MGEKQKRPFQLSFNAPLRVDFQGSRVTSDGGLILVRELDERLVFDELERNHDSRALNGCVRGVDFLRKSTLYRCGLGYIYRSSAVAAECLTDTRAKNAQLPIVDLLRQSVYSRLAGYEDVNDAECTRRSVKGGAES